MAESDEKVTSSEELEQVELKLMNNTWLRFKGREIGSASGMYVAGKDQTRYNEYALYELEGDRYLLHNKYITRWQGEECSDGYEKFESKEELDAYAKEQCDSLIYECLDDAGLTVVFDL